MNKELMKYIPKEYRKLVVDIYLANEKHFDDTTKKWSYPLFVRWINGELSIFQNKSFAKQCLKEFHSPDEYMVTFN